MTHEAAMGEGDALLIVDVQNDFCPGGALPIARGDEVIAPLNLWIAAATKNGRPVIASRDWHPRRHPSFTAEGGPWPVHCLQDTAGAALCAALAVPRDTIIVSKGTRFDRDQYSALDETGLALLLEKLKVRRLFIGGLALDVCVRATALDARRAGFGAVLIEDGTRAVDPARAAAVLRELEGEGVELVLS